MSLSKHRVGDEGCGHRQSEQTMRALRAAADSTHHWRALPFALRTTCEPRARTSSGCLDDDRDGRPLLSSCLVPAFAGAD